MAPGPSSSWPALRLNPRPRIESLAVGGRLLCHVVDDALLDPEAWVDFAVAESACFQPSPGNAFPGSEIRLPDAQSLSLATFFSEHSRRAFDARRVERHHARLSIVDRRPQDLHPRQWQCHVDRIDTGPGESVAAALLYLFRDASLGGTSFYRPLKDREATVAMIQDSAALPPAEFSARHGVSPGYMTASNAWFEKVATVPAAWNRLILYSGTVFHSGEIARPGALDSHPARGRLTINAFFSCRRRAA